MNKKIFQHSQECENISVRMKSAKICVLALAFVFLAACSQGQPEAKKSLPAVEAYKKSAQIRETVEERNSVIDGMIKHEN